MRLCAFLGRAYTRGAIVRRASTAGAGATTWVRGVGACRRGWAVSVGGVLTMPLQVHTSVSSTQTAASHHSTRVCNCLTVAAPRHSEAVPHRAFMGIK